MKETPNESGARRMPTSEPSSRPFEPLTRPAALAAARGALLAHYDRAARDLPWRDPDPDPYRVLVSEVMLQQTRVETVEGYYEAWLDRFPTLEALARADEDEVLKAWEGLGYYRRARNLHRAARLVRERWNGALPTVAAELATLPGVGEYTAGAVASIAFGEVVPAVDGNVRRVLSRLHDVAEPTARWLRETAAAWVDPERPGDFNQALMELGATVCTPRAPGCTRCPVSDWCAARAAGTVADRPAAPKKRHAPTATFALAVAHRGGRVLVVRRPEGGLLAGMWAFPERELAPGSERAAADCDATGSVGEAAMRDSSAVVSASEARAPESGASGGGAQGPEAAEWRASGSGAQGPEAAKSRANGAGAQAPEGDDGPDPVLGLVRALGLEPTGPTLALPEVRHRFTHLEARYRPVAVEVEGGVEEGRGMERAGETGHALGGDVEVGSGSSVGGAFETGRALGGRAPGVDSGSDLRRPVEVRWIDADAGDVALPVAQRKILAAWREAFTAEVA